MDGRGGRSRGRGRGRGGLNPTRPPTVETLALLGAASRAENADAAVEDQFSDAVDQGALNGPGEEPSAPIEGNRRNIEAVNSVDSSKDAEKKSPTKFNPNSPEFTPNGGRLNPEAAEFTPPSSKVHSPSKLNPETSEFLPTGIANNIGNHDIPRQPAALKAKRSLLNPNCSEFVPTLKNKPASQLSVQAPEFVPLSLQNGGEKSDAGTSSSGNKVKEEEMPSLKPLDIVLGFQYIGDPADRDGSEAILKATAEMLIKATIYPASFERLKLKLDNTFKAWPPSDNDLLNLAEMLIHWGIEEPTLRYSASRICQVLNGMTQLHDGKFQKFLVRRLSDWFKKKSSETISLVNLSLFFAEIFSRLKIEEGKETPLTILAKAVLELLKDLLSVAEDERVVGACHILKLTGPQLDANQDNKEPMDNLIKTLEDYATDETLPINKQSMEIIVRMLELRSRKWGRVSQPAISTSTTSTIPTPTPINQFLFEESLVPDVSSEEADGGEWRETGATTSVQQPVTNPDEWNEFLDDNNELIEDVAVTDSYGYVMASGSGQEEEMDEEMHKEFEYFVQDLEDHLLNIGEMDPEHLQENSDS